MKKTIISIFSILSVSLGMLPGSLCADVNFSASLSTKFAAPGNPYEQPLTSAMRDKVIVRMNEIAVTNSSDIPTSEHSAYWRFVKDGTDLWPNLDEIHRWPSKNNYPMAILWIPILIIVIPIVFYDLAQPAYAPTVPPPCDRSGVPFEAIPRQGSTPEQACLTLRALQVAYPKACFSDLLAEYQCVFSQ
jgi:hypothetical protein